MAHFKRTFALIISSVFTLVILCAGSSYAANKKVVIAGFPWATSEVNGQIMKQVLEERLNIPAEIKIMQQPACWAGMDKGTVDVHPDIWYPNQAANVKNYVEERKSVEVTVSYEDCRQGFVIPTWVAEKYQIKTVADLNKHAKEFDITGDGRGDIWCGGFGWFVTEMYQYKLRDYGLDFDPLVLEQYAIMTILNEHMRKKKPIVFVFWTPEWPFAVYDMTWVEEPAYDPAKYKFVPGKPEESYIASADAKTFTYIGYSKKLKDKNPRAYQFFKNWHMPSGNMTGMLVDVQDVPGNPKKDPAEVAKNWIADNPYIVNEWVKGIE